MNFVIGLVLVYGIAVVWGLPNLHPPTAAIVGETACVAPEVTKGELGEVRPVPARRRWPASSRATPSSRSATPTCTDFDDMAAAVRKLHGPTPFVVERERPAAIHHHRRRHADPALHRQGQGDKPATQRSAPSASARPPRPGPPTTTRCPRCPPPSRSPATWPSSWASRWRRSPPRSARWCTPSAAANATRAPRSAWSGASIIGGDTVDHGLWVAFWFFLAQLNFVLGAINLVPLLPFDGGHIAIAVFEKMRNMIRRPAAWSPAAPVNYLKLMPATYVVLVVVVGYMLLTVTADLVNPIRLFQ